jgi:hypothetical protein
MRRNQKDADILGAWMLTQVLHSANIASLTDQQAVVLIGKILVMRRDSVMFKGEPYRAPELVRYHHDAARTCVRLITLESMISAA